MIIQVYSAITCYFKQVNTSLPSNYLLFSASEYKSTQPLLAIFRKVNTSLLRSTNQTELCNRVPTAWHDNVDPDQPTCKSDDTDQQCLHQRTCIYRFRDKIIFVMFTISAIHVWSTCMINKLFNVLVVKINEKWNQNSKRISFKSWSFDFVVLAWFNVPFIKFSVISWVSYYPVSGQAHSTVKSLYNALFGVHRNGPCYKWAMFLRDNFTKVIIGKPV